MSLCQASRLRPPAPQAISRLLMKTQYFRIEVQSGSDARMAADFEILDPESLAHFLLQHDEICREDLCKLLHAAVSQLPESHGKLYSGMRKPGAAAEVLHDTCAHCPSVIRALNQHIAQLLPEASYNALVVLENLKSPAHKDSLNATVPSWVLPIGNFTAGCLARRPRR